MLKKRALCKFNIFLLLGLAMVFNGNHMVHAGTRSVNELIERLQLGGYIIYIRHSKTRLDQRDLVSDEVFDDCNSQRNLSYEGKMLATMIADKVKQLAIPIGQVYSSPYCRAKETAQLLFDKFTVEKQLAFSITKSEIESKKLGEQLRLMMFETPEGPENTVFVGHTSNLRDGLGIWPKPEGVWIVFKKTDSNIKYIGRISPADWREMSLF